MKSKAVATSTSSGPSRVRTIFYTIAALIALVGVAEATYLTVMFLSGETAVCGGSSDCAQVLGSAYAKIGRVPLSGLGALAYFSVFSFATFAGFGHTLARKFFNWTVIAVFCLTIWLLYLPAVR